MPALILVSHALALQPPAGNHPVITEILYAVPTYEGDANRDNSRSAAGDEFIELMNPTDKPIQLRGYTLTDRNPEGLGRFRFRFPDLELGPGEIAVVFNGHGCSWVGPVGDDRRAPPGKHDLFRDAWVFTARIDSSMTSLANAGDWVLLSDPSGKPVQCVRWGEMAEYPPLPEDDLDQAPKVFSQSIVRDGDGRYRPHSELLAPLRFSPGLHEPPSPPPTEIEPPDPREGPADEPPDETQNKSSIKSSHSSPTSSQRSSTSSSK